MSFPVTFCALPDVLPDHEQKQAALSYLNEAWAEARHDGVDGDCLAQASLFAALAELVTTYGEDAVATNRWLIVRAVGWAKQPPAGRSRAHRRRPVRSAMVGTARAPSGLQTQLGRAFAHPTIPRVETD